MTPPFCFSTLDSRRRTDNPSKFRDRDKRLSLSYKDSSSIYACQPPSSLARTYSISIHQPQPRAAAETSLLISKTRTLSSSRPPNLPPQARRSKPEIASDPQLVRLVWLSADDGCLASSLDWGLCDACLRGAAFGWATAAYVGVGELGLGVCGVGYGGVYCVLGWRWEVALRWVWGCALKMWALGCCFILLSDGYRAEVVV